MAHPPRPPAELRDADRRLPLRGDRRSHRDEELGPLGREHLLGPQGERLGKEPARFRKKVQRPAEERDRAADRLTAGEAGNGLVDDGLEDAGRDILPACALVDEGLHVGLGEHAAARGDRIDRPVVSGELVQPCRVGLQEARHLVDKSARPARAGAVHALLQAAGKVRYLRVLAAELYCHVGSGEEAADRLRARDDLLDKGEFQPLGHGEAARARHRNAEREVRAAAGEPLIGSLNDAYQGAADVGPMPLVCAVEEGVRGVQDGELDCRRPHIDAGVEDLVHANQGFFHEADDVATVSVMPSQRASSLIEFVRDAE